MVGWSGGWGIIDNGPVHLYVMQKYARRGQLILAYFCVTLKCDVLLGDELYWTIPFSQYSLLDPNK
jgi:hypothetical protein